MNKKRNTAGKAHKARSLRRLFAFESLEHRALLAGVYEATVLADSPVAYWRLGEPNSATTFADISGNGLSGTKTGGTFGEVGAIVNDADTSARFTSVGTGLQVNDNNLLTPPGIGATFEAWIRPDSYGGSYQNIISKRSITTGWEYTFVLAGSGYLHFNAIYNGGFQSIVQSNVQVALNQWQHVAATVGNGTVRIYLNGAEVATGSSGTFQNTTAPVVIGQAPGEGGAFQFFGRIDEVAIYPTALSASRIISHYFAGAFTALALTGDYQTTTLADNPTAYWRLGEANSTSSIADSSGNGIVGSRSGGTFGQTGALADDPNTSALNLGAVVADSNLLTPGTAATFEAWIKPNNAGNGTFQNIISKRSDPGTIEYGFYISPFGSMHFVGGPGGADSNRPTITSGQWQHVAATVQGNVIRLYLNGIEVAVSNGNSGTFQNTDKPVVIGFIPSGNNQFQGVIDEVAFYRTALPQSRIVAHYLEGTNFKPTDISLSSQSVAENQSAGTLVGTLSSSDTVGNTHTYALVAGDGDTDNASFEIVGNQLRTIAPINVTETTDFTVRVRTTDQGQRSFEKPFTISVDDEPTFHKHINVVGKLRGPGDVPLLGTHSVQFSLYDVAMGGSPFWTATNSTVNVEGVPGGHFQQDLLNLAPLSGALPENVYLAISIDGNAATNRIQLDGDLATLAAGSVTLRDVMVSSSTRNGDDATYALRVLGNLRNLSNTPVTGTMPWTAALFSSSNAETPLFVESGQVTISDSLGGAFGVLLGTTTPLQHSLFSDHPDLWVQWTINGELFTDRIKIDGGEVSSDSTTYRLVSGQATRSFDIEDQTQYGPDTLNIWTLFQDSQTGLPLTGNHSVTYSVFDTSSGGTVLFTETASIAIQDSVYGSYVHALGSNEPLDFDLLRDIDNLWIELSVDGKSSSLPRTSLQTAPFFARASVDQTPPVVASTSFLASGTLIANATSTAITFNEPVLSANIASNYELRRAGADGLLGNGDDPIITISSVTMAGNTATLNFAALTEDVYRLTVKDNITDAAGNALDGDGNGSSGGNWRKDFVVGALSTSFTSPNGFVFDPEFGGFGAGQLAQGTSNAFDGLGRLSISGVAYSPTALNSTDSYETLTGSSRTNLISAGAGNWVDVPGLSTSITTDVSTTTRLSTQLQIGGFGSSGSYVSGAFRFVVDGVPAQDSTAWINAGGAGGGGSGWAFTPFSLEDYVSLSAGNHQVKVQARYLTIFGTVDQLNVMEAAGGIGTAGAIRTMEFNSIPNVGPSVNSTETITGSSRTNLIPAGAGNWLDVPGLSTNFTTNVSTTTRLSTQLLIGGFGSSGSYVSGAFRFVVDGVPAQDSTAWINAGGGFGWTFTPFSLEDYVSLSAGNHQVKVQARYLTIFGTVDQLNVMEAAGGIGTAGAIRTMEFNSIPNVGPSVNSTETITGSQRTNLIPSGVGNWVDVPGLSTSITTDVSTTTRLSTQLLIGGFGASGSYVSGAFRFVVDGVPAQDSTAWINAGGGFGWAFTPFSLEDYVSLSAGNHQVKVQARYMTIFGSVDQLNVMEAAGGIGTAGAIRTMGFNPIPQLGNSAQTLNLSAQTFSGLQVLRAVNVSSIGDFDFSRSVDALTNSTSNAITLPVRIVGNLGSDAATTVFATSDGDLNVEPTDRWFGTDDADGTGTPAIIHLLHGPFGLQPASVNVVEDNVEWTYDLTVPAGATRRLAYFTVLGTTRAEAIAAANTLVTANGFGGEAAAFLTAGELSSLANFQFNTVPTDLATSQSSVAENLPNGSTVGTLTTVDSNVGDQFVYSLVSGSGDTDNSSFAIEAGLLKTNAVFNYEAKNIYAIRVRTTDLGGLSFEKELTITVENALERTAPVQVGDGTVQRSVVNKLVILFDHAIEFDAGAFQVFQRVRDNNNALVLVPVTTSVTLAATAGGMTATLTFSGALTRVGTNALVDGNYQLTINGGLIRILNTTKTFDADGDGNGGGFYTLGTQSTDNFFALLGDANGNGEVDAQDLLGAKLALRKTIGQAGYNSAYDVNGNGVVDAQDILNIQLNLRKKRVFF